jgi:hypothetical protein
VQLVVNGSAGTILLATEASPWAVSNKKSCGEQRRYLRPAVQNTNREAAELRL